MGYFHSTPTRAWPGLALGCLVLGIAAAVAEERRPADRLEGEAAIFWEQGEPAAAIRVMESAMALDPDNPRRPFRLAGWLLERARAGVEAGEVSGAAEAYAGAERHLGTVIDLTSADPEERALTAEALQWLAEIAREARQDPVKAAEYRAEADRIARASPAEVPPGGPDRPAPAARVVRKPVAIGAVNAVEIGGRRLRLAVAEERGSVSVREYVPTGETRENWSAQFVQRIHRQALAPGVFATRLAERVANDGGRILASVAGPGETASVAFVMHSRTEPSSEINTWRFLLRDGRLVSFQYVERVTGPDHREWAEERSRRKARGWLEELQVRRPVGLGEAVARLADGSETP